MALLTLAISTVASSSSSWKLSPNWASISVTSTPSGSVTVSVSTFSSMPEPETTVLMVPRSTVALSTSPSSMAKFSRTWRRRMSTAAMSTTASTPTTMAIVRMRFFLRSFLLRRRESKSSSSRCCISLSAACKAPSLFSTSICCSFPDSGFKAGTLPCLSVSKL